MLRRLALVPALAAATLLVAAPAPGEPDPAVLTAVEAFPPAQEVYTDCDGVDHLLDSPVFGVLVERSGSLGAEVAVPVTYSGDLADNLVDGPTELVIGAGEEVGILIGEVSPVEQGTLTVTFEPGPGYTLSSPVIDLVVEAPYEDGLDCNDPLEVAHAEQTIEVGGRPRSYGLFTGDTNFVGVTVVEGQELHYDGSELFGGFLTPVVGDAPPGLTYEADRWRGAATTPGTYDFRVRACIEDTVTFPTAADDPAARAQLVAAARAAEDFPPLCLGTAEVQVVVEAAPSSSAPAASPISADARFTG